MKTQPNTPETFAFEAALYFLEGHYLFKYPGPDKLTSKFISHADVVSAFSKEQVDTGWLPTGILRTGHGRKGSWFVYAAPPQAITHNFPGNQLTLPIPATVLVGVGKTYCLWALKGAVTPGSRLFNAPFPNVHGDGRICWGSNPVREAEPGIAPAAWGLFFSSPFNRDLVQGKSKSFPEDIAEQLTNLAATGARKYPLSDLVPYHDSRGSNTLEEVVERLVDP
jgi:hypothetical protein